MATSPFMSAFINQLVGTTMQQHQRNEAEAQRDVEQQQAAYQELLKSDRPDLQAIALTGLLEKPKKDIFGHLKKSENFGHAQSIIDQIRQQPPQPGGFDLGALTAGQAAPPAGGPPAPPPGPPPAVGGQAPPPTGAAAMPGTQALTGGGSPQPPVANSSAIAAPVAVPGGAHPADNVHPQGVQGYAEMLALSRAKDPYGLDPMHQQFRHLVSQMQMLGIPVEEGRRMIHDQMMPAAVQAQQLRSDTAESVAGTRAKSATDVANIRATAAAQQLKDRYAQQERMADVNYAHQRALKILGINQANQRVTWQEIPDPSDPDGVRTMKVPISQAQGQAMAASGQTLSGKTPGALASRLTSAIAAKRRLEHVQGYFDQLQEHLGPLAGRVTKLQDLAGVQDPVVQRFLTDSTQIAAYLTSVHAARGKAFLDAMEKGLGQLKDNPEAFKAALEESVSGAEDYIDTVRPIQRQPGGGPPAPPAVGGGAAPAKKGGLSPEEEAALAKL